MKPKWQKLASLAQDICTLWFQFFGAIFASKGYPFKNIFIMVKILIWKQQQQQTSSPMGNDRSPESQNYNNVWGDHILQCSKAGDTKLKQQSSLNSNTRYYAISASIK